MAENKKASLSFSEAVKAECEALEKGFTSTGKENKIDRRRETLRRLFCRFGTMSDPEKAYHLEFVCDTELEADTVQSLLERFEIRSGRMRRKDRAVVYLKDGEDIAKLLNIIGAHKMLLEMENRRIVRQMRGKVNRRVNCDAANIKKTVGAAAMQTEAIAYLEAHGGLRKYLPKPLYDAARARLSFPEATIEELGAQMKPPLKKSGMNHRLQKIIQRYKEVREDVEEKDQDR